VSVLIRCEEERVRGGGILGISCGEDEEKKEGEKEGEEEVTPRHFPHNAMGGTVDRREHAPVMPEFGGTHGCSEIFGGPRP